MYGNGPLGLLMAGLAAALIFLTAVFVAAHRRKRYDVIDSVWGMTFIVVALTWAWLLPPALMMHQTIRLLILGAVVVWGLRLSAHIFRRFLGSREEDPRYTQLRRAWGSDAWYHPYVRIYVVQAVLATLVVSPVLVVLEAAAGSTFPINMTAWSYAAIGLWAVGFACEVVADRQLRAFVSRPANKGKLMTRGLWRYSRHPNYFGELLQWWAIGLYAYSVTGVWFAWVGPLVISWLIVGVSGIPPAEARAAERPGWASYKRRTRVLVPWWPRSSE